MVSMGVATTSPGSSGLEFFQLNADLNKSLKQFASSFDGLIQSFKSDPDQYNNSKGISFLSLKNMLMIEYLTNLMQVIYLKTTGQKISGDLSIVRLAELRTVLEKTKSIELKLKYQIDKLLKIASNTNTGNLNSDACLIEFKVVTERKQRLF